MPRGRPSLGRTKEEALAARREQIRKNVQAFRQRKQAHHELDDGSTVKDQGYTFVVENSKRDDDRGSKELSVRDSGQNPDPIDSVAFQLISQMAAIQNNWSGDQSCLSLALPLELKATKLSLQQLVAGAAHTFCPSKPAGGVGPHWTQTLPLLANLHSTLDLSIQALCLLQIGNVHSQPWLVHQSLSFYDRALSALRVTLINAQNGTHETHDFKMEIFAAAMALAAYELLSEGKGDKRTRGWKAHIEGAVTYLNMFPGLDIMSFCHQLSFHFLETICIFDALGARRPSCFSTSRWWRSNVDCLVDETYGALLRMITTLPSMLEKVDEAQNSLAHGEEVAGWTDLLRQCMRLEAAFVDWFERTLSQNIARQPWTNAEVPACVLQASPHLDPDPSIEFPSLYFARMYLLYWSCMILVYESLITVRQNIELEAAVDTLPTTSPSLDPVVQYLTIAHTFALKIRYSVRYCARPEHGVVGRSVMLLPIWIARNHLKGCGDTEAEWCDGVIEGLGMNDLSFGLKVKKGL